VTKILVPLDGSSDPWVRAAYFALEFAKRTAAKVLFLSFAPGPGARPARRQPLDDAHVGLGEELDHLIAGSLALGIQVETYVTNGDFVEGVAEFARHHKVSRIVLALPEGDDPASTRAEGRLNALQEQLNCVLVTVRSRQDQAGATVRNQ
jgi:Universal stress protein family